MSAANCVPRDGESLRDRKARLTREAIHRSAVGLSYERGLDAATVAQIADEAGISQRTFFNYFASKEDAVIGTAASGPDEQLVRDALASADFSSGVLEATAELVREVLSRSLGDAETERRRRAVFMRNPALVQRNADAGSALVTVLIDALTPRLADALDPLALPEGTSDREAARMIVLIALAPLRHSFVRATPSAEGEEAADDDSAADDSAADDTEDARSLHDRFDHSLALFRTVLEGFRI